jgi:hypothetical protein
MKRSIMLFAVVMAPAVLMFAKKQKDDVIVTYDKFKESTLVLVETNHGVRNV